MKDNYATNEVGELKVLGIDLAKQSFQLHGVDRQGRVVLKMCFWLISSSMPK
jgi:hypothetical protein